MKHKKFAEDEYQKTLGTSLTTAVNESNQDELGSPPSPDEVARRACFSCVTESSLQGHEVRYWLAAESELIAERNHTRVHGFHNRT
jgi:hypothetical protein